MNWRKSIFSQGSRGKVLLSSIRGCSKTPWRRSSYISGLSKMDEDIHSFGQNLTSGPICRCYLVADESGLSGANHALSIEVVGIKA